MASQRSMPLLCTTISSAASGSESGALTTRASASTRRSLRLLRCTNMAPKHTRFWLRGLASARLAARHLLAYAVRVAMNMASLLEQVKFVIPLVLSLTVHEWAHAYSAYRLGDDTALRMGRLTLNPLP